MHYRCPKDVMRDQLQLQMHVSIVHATSPCPCSALTLQLAAEGIAPPHRSTAAGQAARHSGHPGWTGTLGRTHPVAESLWATPFLRGAVIEMTCSQLHGYGAAAACILALRAGAPV